MSPYKKYENPDKRCKLPFKNDPLGYCWGYANAVDNGVKKDSKNCALNCEFWEGNKDMPMPWQGERYKKWRKKKIKELDIEEG